MKQTAMIKKLFIFIFIGISPYSVKSQSVDRQDLVKIIDSLYSADQSTVNIKPPDSAVAKYQKIIRSNFPMIFTIFKKYGFPRYSLVGKEISNKYFTLVQHSDFNVPFQQQVLKEMRKHVNRQDASGQNLAYLTDRIELNNGRPQIYGTQVLMSINSKIKSCIDTSNLNRRRSSVGLSTIEEYLKKCNDIFYQLNPDKKAPAHN